MARTVNLISVVLTVASSWACKPIRSVDSSRVQDLNEGAMMNGDKETLSKMKKDRKVVVVYYANDTYSLLSSDPAQQNFWALRDLLMDAADSETDQAAKDALTRVATRMGSDWDLFNDSIGQDVSALTAKLCSNISPEYRDSVGGLVVFRNQINQSSANPAGGDSSSRLERNLRYDVCKPGDAYTQGGSLRVARDQSFPYQSQPFSSPLVFERALEAVRKEFPGSKHRYILITKSHGSRDYAISPHLSVDLREQVVKDGMSIVEAVKKTKAIASAGLDPLKVGDPILADIDDSLKVGLSQQAAPTDFPGVSKREYLNILNRLGGGNDPMNFPIVLMQACKSDLNLGEDHRLKSFLRIIPGAAADKLDYSGFKMPNVGLLYTSDLRGLGYDSINYWELSAMEFNGFEDFQDIIKTYLDNVADGPGH